MDEGAGSGEGGKEINLGMFLKIQKIELAEGLDDDGEERHQK